MNRFKFRCWDKENKKFLDNLSVNLSANGTLILWRLEGKKYIDLNDNNRYLLMQCTGLKDKNGKLIYEKDIVKFNFDSDEIKAVVSWDDKETGFYLNTTDYFKDKYVIDYDFCKNDYRVIGNIHENPELLEDNNDF